MPSPPEERVPRKKVPTPPAPTTSLVSTPDARLPSAGGRSAPTSKFTPKYVPRLINYQVSDYQDENWRN